MFWNFCVGIHRYGALTYDVMNLISHVYETRKFVMAILHWKQGLSLGTSRVMGAIISLGCNWWSNMHQIDP